MNQLVNALNVKAPTHSDLTINQTLDRWIIQAMFQIQKLAIYLATDQTMAQSVLKSNDQASYRPLTQPLNHTKDGVSHKTRLWALLQRICQEILDLLFKHSTARNCHDYSIFMSLKKIIICSLKPRRWYQGLSLTYQFYGWEVSFQHL